MFGLAAEGAGGSAGVCGWTWDSLKATLAGGPGSPAMRWSCFETVSEPDSGANPKVPDWQSALPRPTKRRQLIEAGIHDVSDFRNPFPCSASGHAQRESRNRPEGFSSIRLKVMGEIYRGTRKNRQTGHRSGDRANEIRQNDRPCFSKLSPGVVAKLKDVPK